MDVLYLKYMIGFSVIWTYVTYTNNDCAINCEYFFFTNWCVQTENIFNDIHKNVIFMHGSITERDMYWILNAIIFFLPEK